MTPTPYQLRCIQDAATIQSTAPLPTTVTIRKACPTCSRLFMAWAAAPDDDARRAAYLTHRAGCGMRMGER